MDKSNSLMKYDPLHLRKLNRSRTKVKQNSLLLLNIIVSVSPNTSSESYRWKLVLSKNHYQTSPGSTSVQYINGLRDKPGSINPAHVWLVTVLYFKCNITSQRQVTSRHFVIDVSLWNAESNLCSLARNYDQNFFLWNGMKWNHPDQTRDLSVVFIQWSYKIHNKIRSLPTQIVMNTLKHKSLVPKKVIKCT